MTIIVSKSKLKAHALTLFRQMEETGEDIIVTHRDRPVAHIKPIHTKKTVEEVFKDWRGKAIFLEDPDTPTIEEWSEV